MRYVGELDADIFREAERGLEIEVRDIECDKLGVFSIEDDIQDKLDKIQGSSFGTNATRVIDVIAADGDAGAIGVGLFRACDTYHFGVGDLFAMLLWDVLISDDLEGIGAFDTLSSLGGVGADTLAEAAEFIRVGAVPDVFVSRMLAEFAMLQGLASGGVKEVEGPVVDDVRCVLAACS